MPKKKQSKDEHEYQYKKEYESDWDIHRSYIQTFDAYEAMLLGQVYDSVSHSIDSSKITDSYTSTLAKERADRVIAKLPDGETESAGKADVGKAAFMDILRQKWIFPNANSQHPFLEKLNMWQLYSSVYGYMPMFYDWNIAPNGYVGPDCWLWNPRNLIPQQGRTSISDMDYITALTWVSKKYIDGLLDKEDGALQTGGWDREALKLLSELAENEMTDPDTEKDTLTERNRIAQSRKKGICLATRYEAGEDGNWCVFGPDHSSVQVREIKNPHKNGRIPFVIKYSQPLYDSFYGLGDFQRSQSLQFGRDGLRNFYFKGIKMNLIPPIVANANGVVKHTLDYREGAVMLETIPNSIRRMETSTAGLSTYQAAMSDMTGSLLSLYGTQNASLPGADALNPTQGKTPAAIDLYNNKEATRDGAERRHLEAAVEQLTDGMFSLVATIGTEEIPVSLFAKDIEEIAKAGLQDVLGLFYGSPGFSPDMSLQAGDLRVDPTKLKGVEYRFSVTPNSTAKVSKEKQLAELERFVDNIGKFQNIIKDDPRIELHPDRIAAAYGALADIKGAEEFITVKPGPSPEEVALMEENEQLKQAVAQSQSQLQDVSSQMAELEASQPVAVGGQQFRNPELADAANRLAVANG